MRNELENDLHYNLVNDILDLFYHWHTSTYWMNQFKKSQQILDQLDHYLNKSKGDLHAINSLCKQIIRNSHFRFLPNHPKIKPPLFTNAKIYLDLSNNKNIDHDDRFTRENQTAPLYISPARHIPKINQEHVENPTSILKNIWITDIWMEIYKHLPLHDILQLRQASW